MKVRIDSLVYGGYGLARNRGKVLFIPFGIPGDELEIEITEDKKDYAFGSIKGLLTPSPHRVSPSCPSFGQCGGCQWLHIDYSFQLAAKEKTIKRELRHVLKGDTSLLTIVPSQPHLGYRIRAQFKVSNGAIGFYQERSHRFVPIGSCPLLSGLLNKAILKTYSLIRGLRGISEIEMFGRGDEGALLITMKGRNKLRSIHRVFHELREALSQDLGLRVIWRGKASRLGLREMREEIAGHDLFVSYDAFFQNNRFVREKLVEDMLEIADHWLAGSVLELYAGVGTFSVPLSERAGRLLCVEAHPGSVVYLKRNTTGKGNTEVMETSCERALEQLQGRNFSLVILNPPRSGCSPKVREALMKIGSDVIIYVSCNPTTMARDIKGWENQGYILRRVRPFDMFPHTSHLEVIALLERAKS